VSDFRIGSGKFFDRGIEKITFRAMDVVEGLPDLFELTPAERARRPMLDQLLALRNLETFLDESVQPDVDDLDLLLPGAFRQAMERMLATLRQASDRRRSADPQVARRLDRAVRLLAEEADLRELLAMYRAALLKG
jgi:type III secretion protein X